METFPSNSERAEGECPHFFANKWKRFQNAERRKLCGGRAREMQNRTRRRVCVGRRQVGAANNSAGRSGKRTPECNSAERNGERASECNSASRCGERASGGDCAERCRGVQK